MIDESALQLMEVAPLAGLTLLLVFAGWWLGQKSKEQTIKVLKEWIEYLKRNGNG